MALTATRLLDNYIAGEWVPARDPTDVLDVTNPATGEVLARVPLSTRSELDAAVAAVCVERRYKLHALATGRRTDVDYGRAVVTEPARRAR